MNQNYGITLILIAALAWSTAGLFTRVVTTDIPTTLFWRSLLGGAIILFTTTAHLVTQSNRRATHLSKPPECNNDSQQT